MERRRHWAALLAIVFPLLGGGPLHAAGSGSTQQDAGLSCKAILLAGFSSGDGLYWIDPNGGDRADAFQAYCDMTTDGGGWTLAVNSVAGEEPVTTDMTSNTGVADYDRAHTRNLTNLAINNDAEIRYLLDNTANSRFFHAKYTGRYHNALPPTFASWTTLAGHIAGSDALISYHFGKPWSTPIADRDGTGGACTAFYTVPWYYDACWTAIPTNAQNGYTQGPVAASGSTPLSRFSIFVREVPTIVIPPTHVAPSFRPAVNISVGGGPTDVATGDFDNDGRADILTANALTGVSSISIRYGNGATLEQPASPGPHLIAIGRFNGDTLLDFALANAGGQITTYLNQGSSFIPIPFSGCVATGIGAADFDQNGTTDLALGCAGASPLLIAANNGAGSFSLVNSLGTGTSNTSLAVADFNGDGRSDIVVTGGSTGCFTVFLGTGGFTFAPIPQCLGTFIGPVAVGDLIGDGNPDLVVGAANTISVLGNVGGGFFSPVPPVTVPSVNDVALGDFDLDGRLDLVLAQATATIEVHRGLLGGVFGPPVQFPTSRGGVSVAVGDVNNDGKPDVVTADNLTDSVSLLINAFVANLPPSASNGTLTVIEGTSETGTLSATDPEGSALTFALTGTGTKGTATLTNASTGSYSYSANAGESGTDTFAFTASDGVSTSNTATITVTITPKLTPQITWAAPAPIVYGTTLGGTQLNATADVSGTFTYSPVAGTLLGAGLAQPLSVTFAPDDPVHYASATGGVSIDVLQASTTTALAASSTTVAALQPIRLAATVGTSAAGAGVPTGTVTFFDGATPIGSAPLSGGTAALTVNGSAPGPHTFTATYDGGGNFATSASPAASVTVRELTQSTFTFAFPTNSPTASGQRATLGALVLPLGGAVTPTGSVAFFDGGTLLGTAPLSGGVAQLSTTTLAVGPHFILAVYLGNPTFASSVSSPTVHTVFSGTPPAAAPISVAASSAPTALGQPVTFTATITPTPAGGTPTGTVVFLVDNALLGTATLSAVGGVVQAQVTTGALSAGLHVVSAIYVGDGVFGASAAGPIVHRVE